MKKATVLIVIFFVNFVHSSQKYIPSKTHTIYNEQIDTKKEFLGLCLCICSSCCCKGCEQICRICRNQQWQTMCHEWSQHSWDDVQRCWADIVNARYKKNNEV